MTRAAALDWRRSAARNRGAVGSNTYVACRLFWTLEVACWIPASSTCRKKANRKEGVPRDVEAAAGLTSYPRTGTRPMVR